MKSKYVIALVASFTAVATYAQDGQAGGNPNVTFSSMKTRAAVEAQAMRAVKRHDPEVMIGQQGGEPASHFVSTLTRKQVKDETAAAIKAGEIPTPGEGGS